MKKNLTMLFLSIIFFITICDCFVYSQDAVITPASVNQEVESNSVRAKERFGGLKGSDVRIEGIIASVEPEHFPYKGYLVFLSDNYQSCFLKVKFETQNKDAVMKLNKGDHFTISGKLIYFENVDYKVYEFAIEPTSINDESLKMNISYANYDYAFTSEQFSFEEYDKGNNFNNIYGDKIIKLTGTVEDKSNMPGGMSIVVLSKFRGQAINPKTGDVQIYIFPFVECLFPNAIEASDNITKGSKVNIIGKFTPKNIVEMYTESSALRLVDCSFTDDSSLPNSGDVNSSSNMERPKAGDATKDLSDTSSISSITYSTYTDVRDNQNYKYLEIDGKYWLAENFRYNCEGSYCYGDNNESCENYGRLYTWDAAKQNAPYGWRLPTIKEWESLIKFAGGKSKAGTKLVNGGSSGLNLLFGGDRDRAGTYENQSQYGFFWTSKLKETLVGSLMNEDIADYYVVTSGGSEVVSNRTSQKAALSVRYVRDKKK